MNKKSRFTERQVNRLLGLLRGGTFRPHRVRTTPSTTAGIVFCSTEYYEALLRVVRSQRTGTATNPLTTIPRTLLSPAASSKPVPAPLDAVMLIEQLGAGGSRCCPAGTMPPRPGPTDRIITWLRDLIS